MIPVRSFGASSAHRGLWLEQQLAPGTVNHALFMWDVDGRLDVAVMESAFRHVLDEAELLRITFVDDGSQEGGAGLRLAPRELGDWRPFYLDVSAAPDPEEAARAALAEVVGQPFDLERDVLVRLGLVELASDRFLVVVAYHHLVSDGYGAGGLLSRRIAEVYSALAAGSEVPQLAHGWDVEPVAAEDAAYRASRRFADDAEFWRAYLADAPAPARIPHIPLSDPARAELAEPMSSADRWAQLAGAIGVASRTLTVSRAEAARWAEAAESMGVWMSSLVAGAAAVLFRHRCDLPEFLFSLAVGNRVGLASRTPGLAVNVVPVRLRVPLDATFAELADALGNETYEIFGHAACHYSDIQRASGTALSDRASYGAVVNVVDFLEQIWFGGHPARYVGGTTGVFAELALCVYYDGSPDSDLFVRLDAPANLYSGAELRFIGDELVGFLRALIATGPGTPIGSLDVIGGAGRDQPPAVPQRGTEEPVRASTIPELFARQIAQSPDVTAVVSGEASLSYRALDARSTVLAEELRRCGVGPDVVVGVAMPRSVDLVVALLAVSKAGGAYVPIDPGHPVERVGPVLRDAAARLVLADPASAATLPPDPDVPTVVLDGGPLAGTAGGRAVLGSPNPDNLVAVLPSTAADGVARGVALTHRNMQRFVTDAHGADERGSVLWHSPVTSDALAIEVWLPLMNGGRVVVAPPGELDADMMTRVRAAHRISTVWLAPGAFSMIAKGRPDCLEGLREVWTGGDAVPAAAVARVRQACPEVTIRGRHGPTETTVFATVHGFADYAEGAWQCAVPIGRPTAGTGVHVLGPGLTPVPVGVVGEMYVAGPSVARGYAGRPGQTAERFVPCPLGPPGALMFRTGERVRRDAEGRFEYVGRADEEPRVVAQAEIEQVLTRHPAVVQSVVAARRDASGQHRLVGYVVPMGGRAGLPGEDLFRFAAERLPDPMVPSMFVVMDRLPHTPNGRIDRAALPEPALADGSYRAPRTDTERALAAAFAEALEVDRVGLDDDFFDLGGNSLRAIRLSGLVRDKLNLEMSIRTLFTARTVAKLSTRCKDLSRSSRPALRRRTRDGHVA